MNLYLPNGYVNIPAIRKTGLPFLFVTGGRATGKTYTSLDDVKRNETMFMFMRRMQSQIDIINKPQFSPFKAHNRNNGWTVTSAPISKYNSAFYNGVEDDNGKLVPDGPPIGYTCALSTVANLRGFDASDVEVLIYDEFIPERHERPLKNEGQALLNAYETINRNRELYGSKPLQLLALANANDLANPIFLELGLVSKAEKMRREGKSVSIDEKRGIGMFMLDESPISKQKADTALYRLTQNTDFSRMSLDNEFVRNDDSRIVSRKLSAYRPLVAVGEVTVYEHRAEHLYYVSGHYSGNPPRFGTGEIDRERFAKVFGWLWLENLCGTVEFESRLCEILLTKYLH